jgi:branched-chain amino acid transport system ATP-binding protein
LSTLLQVRDLEASFGAVRALAGVSFDAGRGDFIGLLGPNGSGKTTLFNCITGFVKPSAGSVSWMGRQIVGWRPDRIARAGLVRTFQHPMVFSSATVAENIRLAGVLSGAKQARTVEDVLHVIGLKEQSGQPAGTLAYGHLRQLGLGMALACGPDLLMLDEPTSGLSDDEAEKVGSLLETIHSDGIGLVVVDHNMKFLLPLARKLVVLDAGQKIAEGTPSEVQRNQRVVEAYLGVGAVAPRSAGRRRGEDEETKAGEPDGGVVLRAEDLRVSYGQVSAVRGVNLEIHENESVALIGANGAGKTSTLRAVSGLVPYEGRIQLESKLLRGGAELVARSGIGHALEGRRIFTQLTVHENLLVARLGRRRPGFHEDYEKLLDVFPVLREKTGRLGGELSGGQQQMLAIARALLTRPQLLLLDEPGLGLDPRMTARLAESIRLILKTWKISLLIAEQSLMFAAQVADRYYLLHNGNITGAGSLHGADARDEVLRGYLGEGAALGTGEGP